MDLGLKGRVAIVTGASYGIGRAVAHGLVQEGAKVALCARHGEQLERTTKELGPEALAGEADVSKAAGIATLFAQKPGKVCRRDIFVNNAGGGHLGQILDLAHYAL